MAPVSRPVADLSLLPLLAVAGFASGSGMRLLDPLLPLIAADFATTIGAASAVIAAFALAYGGGQIVVGPLGDRFGKLRIVCGAMLLYGLFCLACAAAFDLPWLVALRAFAGAAAGGVIPLAMAWIGDAVPYAERQATISRFLVGMVMAQLLAGPVSGVVAEVWSWRASFLLLGLLALAVGVLMALRLGPGLVSGGAAAQGRGLGLGGYASLLSRVHGRQLLVSGFVDGFCLFGGAFPFIGSFLIQDFGLSPAEAGLAVAGFAIGAFGYTRAARRLVRLLGEAGLVLWGGALVTAALAGFAIAPSWQVIAALQVFAGLGFYMFHGVLQARATEALPEARATAVSAFAMALFLGQSVGSLVFGSLMAGAGFRIGFAAAAVIAAALAIWIRAAMLPRA